MKAQILKLIYKLLTVILLLVFSFSVKAQNGKLNKTYKWSYQVNKNAIIYLENYDCDVKIEPSDKNIVEFELHINAESPNEEDINNLKKFLENLDFNGNPDEMKFTTKIYESRNSKGIKTDQKIEMKLINNTEIFLSMFEIGAILRLPSYSKLNLSTKYSTINLCNVKSLMLNSYNDKVYAGNVSNPSEINAKYSNIEFNNLTDSKIDLYDCTLEANKAGIIDLKTKYSKIYIDSASNIKIYSYNDKMEFKKTGDVKIDAKYSNFSSIISGDLYIDVYDSNFEIGQAGKIEIIKTKYSDYIFKKSDELVISLSYDDKFEIGQVSSAKIYETKYSDYEIKVIGTITGNKAGFLNVSTSYDDNFNIGSLNSVNVVQSKYTDYNIGLLEKNMFVEGYDDNIYINKVTGNFSSLDVSEKYGEIKIYIPKDLPLKIDSKTKYGKLNLDADVFKTKIHIKNNSEQEYIGIKGVEKEDMPFIKTRGYDVTLSVFLIM